MKTPYISIPLKGMTDTDWIHPLRKYIASIYGPGDHFGTEIAAFHRLRQDVRGSSADGVGRDLLYRYYRQLDLLELRVPVNEAECRVAFTWQDAYTHESTTQHSLAFEKASLLFNLATVCGQIGADSDDVKIAYNAFQNAAGIYNFIMENFLHAPSVDLGQESVKALSKLMLAQAQDVFANKLLNDKGSKPAVVAKVAKGAANLYKAAGDGLQGVLTLKSWGDRIWFQYCLVKWKYFLAVSADYQSQADEAAGKYGSAVAFSQLAVTNLQECARMTIPSQYSAITQVLKASLEAAKLRASALEKDNDFIYHDLVPAAASLPEISAMDAAKPTPIRDLYKDKNVSQIVGREIFEKLIPLDVHEKSSLYSEKKAAMLRNEGEKIEIADEELSSALEFLDLPGSLRLVRQTDSSQFADMDVPAEVKKWASEVQAGGGLTGNPAEVRQRIQDSIRRSEQALQEEEREQDRLRSQYASQWTQAPSRMFTSGIYSDFSSIRDSLQSGADSDLKVNQLIRGHEADIRTLSLGPSSGELEHAFRQQDASTQQGAQGGSLLDLDSSDEADVEKWLNQTEDLLTKLSKISKERKNLYSEFKEKVHSDDISSLLVLNNKVPDVEEQLFKSELEKFQPYRTRIDSSIHHQHKELQELTLIWKKVLSNDSVKKRTSSREGAKAIREVTIERFRSAHHKWAEASEGFSKGKEFYSSIESYSQSVAKNVEEFLKNRRDERRGILASIQGGGGPEEQLRTGLSSLSVQSPGPGPAPQAAAPAQSPGSFGYGDLSALDKPQLPPKPPKPQTQPPQSAQPYGQPQPPQSQPYGQPQSQPYGQPQPQHPQAQPYGQAQQFGQQPQYGQQFGQQYNQPFGQHQAQSEQYRAPQAQQSGQHGAPQPHSQPQAPLQPPSGYNAQAPGFGAPSAYDPSMYGSQSGYHPSYSHQR